MEVLKQQCNHDGNTALKANNSPYIKRNIKKVYYVRLFSKRHRISYKAYKKCLFAEDVLTALSIFIGGYIIYCLMFMLI